MVNNTNTFVLPLKSNIMFWSLRILALMIITYVIIVFAWVGDDAQITLRQIWNFIQGNGITFNIPDRVQAFTHPLWFLILSSATFITQELYYTTVILSIVFAITSVLLLLRLEFNQEKSNITVITPILLLLFSWSFFDYTTSGLENPLAFLLVGLLLYYVTRENRKENLQLLYILMALLVLTRFDYFILFLPLAILLLFECKSIKNALIVTLPGLIILILWHSFATFYFGFPLPNTFYSKLATDIPTQYYINNGLEYLNSLKRDTSSTFIIFNGVLLTLISKNKVLYSLSAGLVLYLLYIVWSGGDFMLGRFFSVLIYLSIGLIILSLKYNSFLNASTKNFHMLSLLLICIINGSTQQYPFNKGTNVNYKPRTSYYIVGDERGGNYRASGLWSKERTRLLNYEVSIEKQPQAYWTNCGLLGGLAHSNTSHYLIDLCTLSDPFLARLPPIHTQYFTTGHLIRMMPTNYGERLIGNIDSLPDKKLNDMLNDFLIVTRGNLFSWERFKIIWRLNTGYYDYLDLADYQITVPWKPRTTNVTKVTLDNWSQAIPPDNLPLRFKSDIKKFNGNLLVESKSSSEARGIWFYVDYSFNYDVYVNEQLTFTDISQEKKSCTGVILRLPHVQHVKSIKFVTTGLKDIIGSDSNLIRFLRLLPKEEDVIAAETQECHFEHLIAAY